MAMGLQAFVTRLALTLAPPTASVNLLSPARSGTPRIPAKEAGNRMSNSNTNVAVVGCGRVGAVVAAGLAELGHRVVGLDVDVRLSVMLAAGRPPFQEAYLEELIQRNITEGRLSFTTSFDKMTGCEFVFVCVDTPALPDGASDLSRLETALHSVRISIGHSGTYPVIVLKSTTASSLAGLLPQLLSAGLEQCPIVVNPEFLRQGSAVSDFLNPDRIVVGADDRAHALRVAGLYEPIGAPLIVTNPRSAEMIKLVSNAFLATRASFINEIATLCEQLDLDMDAVLEGVSGDPRIGAAYLTPGIGYGGSCLPKDVAVLSYLAQSKGSPLQILDAVRQVNDARCLSTINYLRSAMGSLKGRRVAAWGATYKGGTNDLRNSPAIEVIAQLRREGASVNLFEPSMTQMSGVEIADVLSLSPIEAAKGADCLAVLADWHAFREIDLVEVAEVMAGRLVYDGRNVLKREQVAAAGLIYCGAGHAVPSFAADRGIHA